MAQDNIDDIIRQLTRLNVQQEDINRQQAELLQRLEIAEQQRNSSPSSSGQTRRENRTAVTTPSPSRSNPTSRPTTPVAVAVPVPPFIKEDWVRVRNGILPFQPREGRIIDIGRVYITVKDNQGRSIKRTPKFLELVRRDVSNE